MKWDSRLYDKSQAFVSEYGNELISFIPLNKQQCILDLGCGTGDLTQKLNEISSCIIGIDSSKEMIQAAKEKYPHLNFEVMDACHRNGKISLMLCFLTQYFIGLLIKNDYLRGYMLL